MTAHSVEDIKKHSARLRGTLRESLVDQVTGALAQDDQTLIKYHGSYQQDDRDLREERRQQKLEPAHAFMIRTRTPGGVVSPTQWLQLDHIATTYAERGLRITTRQAFQFHGVVKGELKATMQAINAVLIDTLAAAGPKALHAIRTARAEVGQPGSSGRVCCGRPVPVRIAQAAPRTASARAGCRAGRRRRGDVRPPAHP